MATDLIQIRGVITSAMFDDPAFASYIERGVITPSSRVLAALYAAEKAGHAVRLEISSPGGDAIAANDVIIAVRKFKFDLQIEVGAFAASAAANIVISARHPVAVHRNTLILWHSAWSAVEGGPQSMRDEARILEDLNRPIRDGLAAHGVPENIIAAGFNEGRSLTMDANELMEYGIAARIIDADADQPQRYPEARAGIESAMRANALAGYLPIAAFEEKSMTTSTDTDTTGETDEPTDTAAAPADDQADGGGTPQSSGDDTGAAGDQSDGAGANQGATPEPAPAQPAQPAEPAPATVPGDPMMQAPADLAQAIRQLADVREQARIQIEALQSDLATARAEAQKAMEEKAALIGRVMAPQKDARTEYAAILGSRARLDYIAKHRNELFGHA